MTIGDLKVHDFYEILSVLFCSTFSISSCVPLSEKQGGKNLFHMVVVNLSEIMHVKCLAYDKYAVNQ